MPPSARTVLVVDDDHATRVGLLALLTRAGYRVHAAADYEEARRALQTRPDLLVTDVRLRDFNGLQLLLGSHPFVPAIVISGFLDPVLEAEARGLGADFVLKPISPTDLLSLIARKLAKSTSP
jgi:DNA-binding NtrC family response regulator